MCAHFFTLCFGQKNSVKDNLHTVSEVILSDPLVSLGLTIKRLRRGKRPFRTYHLSTSSLLDKGKNSETRLVVENQSFDETTHNELKIFESWDKKSKVTLNNKFKGHIKSQE